MPISQAIMQETVPLVSLPLLTRAQRSALIYIARRESAYAYKISRAHRIHIQTVRAAIERLVELDLIQPRPGRNAKAQHYCLTTLGIRAAPVIEQLNKLWLSAISDEPALAVLDDAA